MPVSGVLDCEAVHAPIAILVNVSQLVSPNRWVSSLGRASKNNHIDQCHRVGCTALFEKMRKISKTVVANLVSNPTH